MPTFTRRTEHRTAKLLREGIAMRRAFGLPAAVAFLHQRVIEAPLAARMLAKRFDRRRSAMAAGMLQTPIRS
jgi:hypothetical protein